MHNNQLPSNKKFGCFFSFVFALLSIFAYAKGWSEIAIIALGLSVTLLSCVVVAPQILDPLNRFWYGLGLILGKIVSPLVLGIIFFVLITPTSLIMRLFGRDELRMKKRSVDSYWVKRSPPGPPSDSFNNQY
jgi:hypothetical protein